MKLIRILFATDFSDRSLEAFKSSCRLALTWDAHLHIVHVEDPREIVKSCENRTFPDREFNRFVPHDPAIEFTHEVLSGHAAEEILDYAEKKNVQLIVIATHRREGVQRLFNGNIAETIVRNSKRPVMTCRTKHIRSTKRNLERILVPIDFSVYSDAALDFAGRLASATDAKLTICYVEGGEFTDHPSLRSTTETFQCHDHNRAMIKNYMPNLSNVHFTHKLLQGDPGKEICDYANANAYDFIVLGTHGRTGLTRAIMGSVAEQVVRLAECPVISVKPSTKRADVVSHSS